MKQLCVLAAVIALAACGASRRQTENWEPSPAPDLGVPVARVGGIPIFARQVLAHAKRTGGSARQALEDLVDLNLLAGKARASGIEVPSSQGDDIERAMVERMLERELETSLRPESVPDSAIRPLYDRIRDQFVHPRLVDVGVLAIFTGAPMKGQPREERAKAAEELATFLRAHPPKTLDDFAAVAKEPQWAERNVVYMRKLQGWDQPLSAAVGAEVGKLRAPGDTTPMVTDIDGFFICRYVDERPPENVTFEQARPRLLAGFYERWRQERFLEFTSNLIRMHKVEAHFDRLSVNEQGP